MPAPIAENLAAVRKRIAAAARRSGRLPEAVQLVAVSKTMPASAVVEAVRAGQRLFGENRVQEALAKIEQVGPGPVWHLVGHLQSNKARFVPGSFAAVHSVDSERIAQALQHHAAIAGGNVDVYVQLNWSQEDTKSGVTDEVALRRLVDVIAGCPNLTLKGLMTLPAQHLSEAETRRAYAGIRNLHAGLSAEFALGPAFCELSMGMTHDFEWAIEEGATIVRVGTAIFGARP